MVASAACCDASAPGWHALQVFDHMQASHVEADVVACCSLINALERGGQWQLAEKLFLQMCTVQVGDATKGRSDGSSSAGQMALPCVAAC